MKLFAMTMLVALYAVAMAGFMPGCSDGVCPSGWKAEPGHCMVPDAPKAGSSAVVTTTFDDAPQIAEPDAGQPMDFEGGKGGSNETGGAGSGGNVAGTGGAGEDGKPAPTCGDGLLGDDETCDPKSKSHPCPTADKCISAGCKIAKYSGSPDTCDAKCETTVITARINSDGCCPDGADLGVDNDCKPVCGNGKREDGEACDGDCQTSCDDGNPCTVDKMIGSPDKCDVFCVNSAAEEGTACGDAAYCSDSKCLTGCTVGNPKCAGQPGTGSCVAASTMMTCSGISICVATWIPAGSTCGPNLTCDDSHNCK